MARYSIVAVLLCASGLASGLVTLAAAQPPRASTPARAARTDSPSRASAAPVIARVRTREGVLELTRESIAAGGAAAHLREGVALIADAVPTRPSR